MEGAWGRMGVGKKLIIKQISKMTQIVKFRVAMMSTCTHQQGQQKLFITGQDKPNPIRTIQLNACTADILILSVIVQCCMFNRSKNHITTLFITQLFEMPCTHNVWNSDNLTLIDMLFYFIISLASPKIIQKLLFSTYYL